jgi:predicted DNA-binding transcriptional regulator AlpA
MPKPRHYYIADDGIHADRVYRYADGPKYFGLGLSSIDEKIKTGEIPKPISLSDSGRAKGWLGRTILAWQAERQAKSEQQSS